MAESIAFAFASAVASLLCNRDVAMNQPARAPTAMPMKIESGSGGPLRIVAFLPKEADR